MTDTTDRVTAQDVARLVGVSRSAVSRVFTPGASVPLAARPVYDLTTSRQPVNRMVAATVGTLLVQIEGDTAPSRITIHGPLIERGTVRKT